MSVKQILDDHLSGREVRIRRERKKNQRTSIIVMRDEHKMVYMTSMKNDKRRVRGVFTRE